MDKHLIAYYIGILIVIWTNGTLWVNPFTTPEQNVFHGKMNVLGAAMIAYYFAYQQGFIQF